MFYIHDKFLRINKLLQCLWAADQVKRLRILQLLKFYKLARLLARFRLVMRILWLTPTLIPVLAMVAYLNYRLEVELPPDIFGKPREPTFLDPGLSPEERLELRKQYDIRLRERQEQLAALEKPREPTFLDPGLSPEERLELRKQYDIRLRERQEQLAALEKSSEAGSQESDKSKCISFTIPLKHGSFIQIVVCTSPFSISTRIILLILFLRVKK